VLYSHTQRAYLDWLLRSCKASRDRAHRHYLGTIQPFRSLKPVLSPHPRLPQRRPARGTKFPALNNGLKHAISTVMVNTTGLLRTLASSNGSRDRECALFCRQSSVSMSGQRRPTLVVSTFKGFGLRNLTCARKADGERDRTSQCLNINSPGQLKGNVKLSRMQAFHTTTTSSSIQRPSLLGTTWKALKATQCPSMAHNSVP
jgi:hypothetical protein